MSKVIWLPAGTRRVRVADAKRLLREAGRDGWIDVYEKPDGGYEFVAHGCTPFGQDVDAEFRAFCVNTGVKPTSPFSRWASNYTSESPQEDGVYEITFDECRRFLEGYDIALEAGEPAGRAPSLLDASSPTAPQPLEPAKETAEQRQNRRLAVCEAAGLEFSKGDPDRTGYRLPHGIGAMAKAEGVPRQTFADDVRAALMRRWQAQRAGNWPPQSH